VGVSAARDQPGPAPPPASLLEVRGLEVAYGGLAALSGVTLTVRPGELVALVGANGAGKTTLLRCISGLLRARAGHIRWQGEELDAVPPHAIVARGIAMVPEGRRLFPQMTVEENLELGAYLPRARRELPASLAHVYRIFPRLRERRRQLARSLSGGEQQMVAIGRALMTRPRLLMLDEPSLGLAPQMVDAILEMLVEIHHAGLALLLVEQNVQAALVLSERAYVLEGGRVVVEGSGDQLLDDPAIRRAYLGPLALASG
jgi:branched-chain amino acid transport system ATP-binding protein